MSKKSSFWALLGVMVMLALIATACAPAATQAPTEEAAAPTEAAGDKPYEGETVTIFSACGQEPTAETTPTSSYFSGRACVNYSPLPANVK